jgi:hypothetical protein
LLPASRLISWALAVISATVSFTSAPRWPGLRLGGGGTVGAATGVAEPSGGTSGVTGLSAIGRLVEEKGRNRGKYMIFQHFRNPRRRPRTPGVAYLWLLMDIMAETGAFCATQATEGNIRDL